MQIWKKPYIWKGKLLDMLSMRGHVYMDIVAVREKAEVALDAIHELIDEITTMEASVGNVRLAIRLAGRIDSL